MTPGVMRLSLEGSERDLLAQFVKAAHSAPLQPLEITLFANLRADLVRDLRDVRRV
jgi:hypothetical protein